MSTQFLKMNLYCNPMIRCLLLTLTINSFCFAQQMPPAKPYTPQPGDISPEGFNWLHRDLGLVYSGAIYEHNLKGVVRPPELSSRKGQILSYLESLAKFKKTAFSKWALEHQKSFLINEHNARELLKEIDPKGKQVSSLFSAKEVESLIKKDPRILLILHCSEPYCPEYRNRVVNFRNLETMLEQSAHRFFMDKEKNHYDANKNTLYLSPYLAKHRALFPPKSIARYFKNDPTAQTALAKKSVKVVIRK